MARPARDPTLPVALGFVLLFGACFAGDFVQGRPCTDERDCGPELSCVEGYCGGLGELGVCGNGLVDVGEACDDGNIAEGDACTPVCTVPECGDGFVAPGETCDDGNTLDGDGCSARCNECGDGLTQAWEACDPGDPTQADACTSTCQFHACGDGFVGPDEVCDDGNDIETDACTTTCAESPEVPVLVLNPAQVRQFEFSWAPARGAEFYRLYERADVGEPLVQAGDDIVGEAISLTVPLRSRLHAGYVLEACNALRCVASQEVPVVGTLAAAVGYFKASNTDPSDGFGVSVALSDDGETLVVGANGEDSAATFVGGDQTDNSVPQAGAVYVFAREGASWSQQAYLKSFNPSAGALFGSAVALSGDGNTLAVSAPREDVYQQDSGAIYVFARNDGVWSPQGYLKASAPVTDGRIGARLALSNDGNTLAATDTLYQQYVDTGTFYVFARVGDEWSQQLARSADFMAGYGHGYCGDVALSGDGNILAVGSWDGVEMYVRDGDSWSLQQGPFLGSQAGYLRRFGVSVSLSDDGDTLAVGELGEGVGEGLDPGKVYVFARAGQSWVEHSLLALPNPSLRDRFGVSVSLAGDGKSLAIGAIGEQSSANGIDGDPTDDSLLDAGAAYVFVYDGESWSQQSYVKAAQTHAGDQFGFDLALSADAGTLVVGAPLENYAATGVGAEPLAAAFDSGAVFLY
jgi:cysteine-rich repeat protein